MRRLLLVGLDEDESDENAAVRRERYRPSAAFSRKPDEDLVQEAKSALPICNLSQIGGLRGMSMAPARMWNDRIRELIAVIFEGLLWSVTEPGTEVKKRSRVGGPQGVADNHSSYYIEQIQSMVRGKIWLAKLKMAFR